MQTRSDLTRELALLLVLSTLWGASYTFIKIGVETIPPLTLIAARTLIAGLLLAAIIRSRGLGWPRERATWRRFLIQAGLNSVVPFTLIAWAERTVEAGLATILNATSPIFAFLLTTLVTRHEPVTRRKLGGIATGLIVGVEALHGLGREWLAQLAIVAATICYAGAAIVGKGFKGLDPMLPAAGSLLLGAVVLIPLALVIDHPWTLTPSLRSVLALVALATVSTAAAMVIYFRLVQTLGSIGATAQSYLRVPIGVAVAVTALGEHLATTAWIGLACIVIGVVAMALPARKAARNEPAKVDRGRLRHLESDGNAGSLYAMHLRHGSRRAGGRDRSCCRIGRYSLRDVGASIAGWALQRRSRQG